MIYEILQLSTLFVKKAVPPVNSAFLTFFYIFFIFWAKGVAEYSDKVFMSAKSAHLPLTRATFFASRTRTNGLRFCSEDMHAVRPQMVAKGKRLLKAGSYPSRKVVNRLAQILACRILAEGK